MRERDRKDLFTYYERELSYIRRLSKEFSDQHPHQAGLLHLAAEQSPDPHVERLIESFALLAARIHLKLDDEFPEITESLLQVLYPHYLAPVPSMSVVQFALDLDQGRISTGLNIPRHKQLLSVPFKEKLPSGVIQETTCKFRTCYPVTLWPLEVDDAFVEDAGVRGPDGRRSSAAVALRLSTQGGIALSELAISSLRVFIKGDYQLAYPLYESLLGHCSAVGLRSAGGQAPVAFLRPGALSEVGFGKDEGLLPYSTRSHIGYRLILEYFCFPRKFLFFDLGGLDRMSGYDFGTSMELVFLLDAPPGDTRISRDTFRLGCTPIVNLFPNDAETITLDHAHAEYEVLPDPSSRLRSLEVYSIDEVSGLSEKNEQLEYRPFYSVRHSFEGRPATAFWHMNRRPSNRKAIKGTDLFLSLVDRNLRPTSPDTDRLMLKLTCTNRNLPGTLEFAGPALELTVEQATGVQNALLLYPPTRTMRPPAGHGMHWPLISHLSLNYLSVLDADYQSRPLGAIADATDQSLGGSPDVLRDMLKLYDFSDSPDKRQQIQKEIAGLVGVESRQVTERIGAGTMKGFARGIEITLMFDEGTGDETNYEKSGVFLFSSILEKFLALSVSINSFSKTIARSRQRGLVKEWPPRSGYQPLL